MKYTKEDKKEYFKKQMDELKFQIEDKISDFINNSEELKAFIEFRRKHFYSYSLNNSMLIYKQLPSATFVAGYQKWKSLGYQVKKGSKSLKILIPMIRNDKEEDKKVIYGFRTGKVFDISQVEAQNGAIGIPEIDLGIKATPSTKIGLKSILGGVKKFIEQHCKIEEYEDDNGILGKTDGKKIYIADNPNLVDKASILVH